MADKITHAHSDTGLNLYAVFFNSAGNFWNGTAMESFTGSNWGTYAVALSEWGTSKIYRVNIPGLAAEKYTYVVYERASGSPAQSDAVVGSGEFAWDGSQVADNADIIAHGNANWKTITVAAVAGAVLATPANKLATNASGEVAVNATNQTAIAGAVWAAGTRTLSGFGSLVSEIVAAVTPYITGWPSASTIADAVWTRSSRLLSGFGFTVAATDVAAVKVVTDKLATAMEQDGPVYRFTSNALEQSPASGDATQAGQDAILNAIADLAAIDEDVIAEAVMDATVDGALDVRAALKMVYAFVHGKVVRTDDSPPTFDFYNAAGDTVIATLVWAGDGSARNPS